MIKIKTIPLARVYSAWNNYFTVKCWPQVTALPLQLIDHGFNKLLIPYTVLDLYVDVFFGDGILHMRLCSRQQALFLFKKGLDAMSRPLVEAKSLVEDVVELILFFASAQMVGIIQNKALMYLAYLPD